jgi:large subunit ribosomal protein L16
MLQPKKTKHRKAHKGRIKGNAQRGAMISFGSFGLKALEPVWLTNRQIEAARQALTRHMKREGNVWIRVFPDKPITRKPQEVRMGKGKGNLEFWAAVVKPGLILFEAEGVPMQVAKEAFELAAQKLPIKTKLITDLDKLIYYGKQEKNEPRRLTFVG